MVWWPLRLKQQRLRQDVLRGGGGPGPLRTLCGAAFHVHKIALVVVAGAMFAGCNGQTPATYIHTIQM